MFYLSEKFHQICFSSLELEARFVTGEQTDDAIEVQSGGGGGGGGLKKVFITPLIFWYEWYLYLTSMHSYDLGCMQMERTI